VGHDVDRDPRDLVRAGGRQRAADVRERRARLEREVAGTDPGLINSTIVQSSGILFANRRRVAP
jgi:hypothetical protein